SRPTFGCRSHRSTKMGHSEHGPVTVHGRRVANASEGGPVPAVLGRCSQPGEAVAPSCSALPRRGTMAIYRIFRERVFEPEAVISMAKAYEGVLVALRLTHRQDSITELVAKKIVEIAEMGERDPARLRDRALEELRGSTLDGEVKHTAEVE